MSDGASGVALQVERACQDFEAAWKAGTRPSIGHAVSGAPALLRAGLLRALLSIDLLYRRRQGEQPIPEEYHALLPGHEALINDGFRDTPTAAATARSGVVHTMAGPTQPT